MVILCSSLSICLFLFKINYKSSHLYV
jgi:hypothetical protein